MENVSLFLESWSWRHWLINACYLHKEGCQSLLYARLAKRLPLTPIPLLLCIEECLRSSLWQNKTKLQPKVGFSQSRPTAKVISKNLLRMYSQEKTREWEGPQGKGRPRWGCFLRASLWVRLMDSNRIHWANDLLDLFLGKGAGISSYSHTGPSLLLLLKDKPQVVIDTGFIRKALQILKDEQITSISRDFMAKQQCFLQTGAVE